MAHITNSEYIEEQVVVKNFGYSSGVDIFGSHVVCPVETVYDGIGSCLSNPFKSYKILSSPKVNNETGKIEWDLEMKIYNLISLANGLFNNF